MLSCKAVGDASEEPPQPIVKRGAGVHYQLPKKWISERAPASKVFIKLYQDALQLACKCMLHHITICLLLSSILYSIQVTNFRLLEDVKLSCHSSSAFHRFTVPVVPFKMFQACLLEPGCKAAMKTKNCYDLLCRLRLCLFQGMQDSSPLFFRAWDWLTLKLTETLAALSRGDLALPNDIEDGANQKTVEFFRGIISSTFSITKTKSWTIFSTCLDMFGPCSPH